MCTIIFYDEGASSILGIALSIADIQQFIESNRRLIGRTQLLDLPQDLVYVVEYRITLCWTGSGQVLACLAHQETCCYRP